MKRMSKLTVFVVTLAISVSMAQPGISQARPAKSQTMTVSPVSRQQPLFVENQGQWDSRARFQMTLQGSSVWLSAEGATFELIRPIDGTIATSGTLSKNVASPAVDLGLTGLEDVRSRTPYERLVIASHFEGSNPVAQIHGEGLLPTRFNYFHGSDPVDWRTNVPAYSSVTYEGIYDNIDLRYFHNGKNLEYEFIAAPGADLSQIKIRYEGVESLTINSNGDLEAQSAQGVVLRELSPLLYQTDKNGARTELRGTFNVTANHTFSILPPTEYDASRAITIDPVIVVSSTFGGSDRDSGEDVAIDSNGDIYIVGSTWSYDFPIVNGFDSTFAGGFSKYGGGGDAFVSKLSGVDHSLIYSSFLGGSQSDTTQYNGEDVAVAIALDDSGAAYITGRTYAEDFPTVNAYQSVHIGGGKATPFISKVSPNGDALIYSTFLDGVNSTPFIGNTYVADIVVDGTGSAIVAGTTRDATFPLVSPLDASLNGFWDMFLSRLNPDGSQLLYSTLLGGSSLDAAQSLVLDDLGQVIVTGYTWSTDYPLVNEFASADPNVGPNESDVVVSKISVDGQSLVHSSYMGGSIQELPLDMTLGTDGSVYLTGVTSSPDFTTVNAFDETPDGRFAAHIGPAGALKYSTYIADGGGAIAVDDLGYTYITGYYTNLYGYALSKLTPDGDCLIRKDILDADVSVSPNYHVTSMAIGADRTVYLVGVLLGAGNTSTYDAFLTVVPPTPDFVCGDADNSCSMNIADVTFMIARVFAAGPAPVIPDAADANGDGSVNIGDITTMIATIFSGGPASLCGATGF